MMLKKVISLLGWIKGKFKSTRGSESALLNSEKIPIIDRSVLREFECSVDSTTGNPRRWFSSADLDLIIWQDKGCEPTGFQLSYDFENINYCFSFWPDGEISHQITTTDKKPGRATGGILDKDMAFHKKYVLEKFLLQADVLEVNMRNWITVSLASFEGSRRRRA